MTGTPSVRSDARSRTYYAHGSSERRNPRGYDRPCSHAPSPKKRIGRIAPRSIIRMRPCWEADGTERAAVSATLIVVFGRQRRHAAGHPCIRAALRSCLRSERCRPRMLSRVACEADKRPIMMGIGGGG